MATCPFDWFSIVSVWRGLSVAGTCLETSALIAGMQTRSTAIKNSRLAKQLAGDNQFNQFSKSIILLPERGSDLING